MAQDSVASALDHLSQDPWRSANGFSPDIDRVHQAAWKATISDSEVSRLLGAWIIRHQPCLFGRLAASPANDSLTYCILNDSDLREDDQVIQEKILAHREDWWREGTKGKKSGFVILASSPTVATAAPDLALLEFARRICSLYLNSIEITPDRVFRDRHFLEMPDGSVRMWEAGVNVFAAAGDKRWWNDHRIPLGLAFSVNAVGQMIRSSEVNNLLLSTTEGKSIVGRRRPVDTEQGALVMAMDTINGASRACSGPATHLRPLDPAERPALGATQLAVASAIGSRPRLRDKDPRSYFGWYHTDFTIPSIYFRQEVERPSSVRELDLDFTYLYDSSVPDNQAMGSRGVRVK